MEIVCIVINGVFFLKLFLLYIIFKCFCCLFYICNVYSYRNIMGCIINDLFRKCLECLKSLFKLLNLVVVILRF